MLEVSSYSTVEFICFELKNSILYFTLHQVNRKSLKQKYLHNISVFMNILYMLFNINVNQLLKEYF